MITVVLLASYNRSLEIKLRIADNTWNIGKNLVKLHFTSKTKIFHEKIREVQKVGFFRQIAMSALIWPQHFHGKMWNNTYTGEKSFIFAFWFVFKAKEIQWFVEFKQWFIPL